MRVITAILTYNRYSLLKRCIKYVRNQSVSHSDLIIINNGSTDKTSEYLNYNNIKEIKLNKGGSAQGWNAAIDYSIKFNYDFIWLMDDDGYPDQSALEKILENFDKDTICISSIVLNELNNSKLVFPLPKLKNKLPNLFNKVQNYKYYEDVPNGLYPFAHLFNGCLIDVKKVSQLGGINTNFFHHGVELDLYYRMLKSFNVYTLKSAKHFHPDVSKREISKMWVFYYLKNSIIINLEYLNHPFLRSILNIFVTLLRILFRNGFFNFLSYLIGANSRVFYKAIIDGFTKKWSTLD